MNPSPRGPAIQSLPTPINPECRSGPGRAVGAAPYQPPRAIVRSIEETQESVCSDDPNLRLFQASLHRASHDPAFFEEFYRNFIHSSDEIAAVFRDRDIASIQRKLKMTLDMVAEDADGAPGVDMYLQMLGRIHSRLNITPEMFVLWREALIGTVAGFDPAYNNEVEQAWRQVIDRVIAKLAGLPGPPAPDR